MNISWKDVIIALFLSIVLWYGVSGNEAFDTQIEVRLEYKGLRNDLIILNGLVNKLAVQVRAPAGILQTLNKKSFSHTLDLSRLTKGENIIPIPKDILPLWGGIDVIHITPSNLTLQVDTLGKKTVPITVSLLGETPKHLQIIPEIDPESIEIAGPSSLLASIKEIPVVATAPPEYNSNPASSKITIPLPENCSSTTTTATINLVTQLILKEVTVHKPVHAIGINVPTKEISPSTVSITVLAPIIAEAEKNQLNITPFVTLNAPTAGEFLLPVKVSLPDNITLVKVDPKTVFVTIPVQQKTTQDKQQKTEDNQNKKQDEKKDNNKSDNVGKNKPETTSNSKQQNSITNQPKNKSTK